MDFHDIAVKQMLYNIGNITLIYGCKFENNSISDYDTSSAQHEDLRQTKLLYKHIIDITDELYRFSKALSLIKTSLSFLQRLMNYLIVYVKCKAIFQSIHYNSTTRTLL